MIKRILAFIISISVVFACCAFTFAYNDKEVSVEENIVEEDFKVEKLNEFTDVKLQIYTMEELQVLIEKERNDQEKAHQLAALARELGWPEDDDSIESAKAEWWNSQLAIEAYDAQYQKLYEEADMAKWEARKAKYPAATEIWLYMKELGWNDYVCAGIMGNIMTEVGGQTLDIQYWLKGSYYGMCQWSRGYSQIWGADLPTQCDFLRDTIEYEFNTYGYMYIKGFNYNSFLNMSNAKDAALAFAKAYERCGSSSYLIRQKNAEKAYNYFVN